ncbi:MAG: DUF4293 domain-containing protein [Bacteroidales bacterium]
MIQRIQTLYLLIALILTGVLFFFPFAEILSAENELYFFHFNGFYHAESEELYIQTIPSIILLIAIALLTIVIIFLFKKRIIQMRLAFINMLLQLGFAGLIYFYVNNLSSSLEAEAVSYKLFGAIPFIAAILHYLAIRAIGKDEALVRSIDRIR